MPRSGNITGEVFEEGVIKQIDVRQNFLGARYKNDNHLIFQNNQNSFIRLSSSVNIGGIKDTVQKITAKKFTKMNKSEQAAVLKSGAVKDDKGNYVINDTVDTTTDGKNQLKERGLNESNTGTKLAKACVLFGGVVGVDDSLNPQTKFGIVNNGGSDDFDYINTIAAYGWGGIDKGYAPFPGIDSADISFYNRGALQKASVKIKVPTISQLQIFDLLYFRIGYTMLLEWGHNVWLGNDETLKNRTDFVTEPFKKFFTEGTTQQDVIKSIKTQRSDDSYNYDAMLGKITNFKWKFNDDGSYDVELNLIGMGDIIESLKVNKSVVAKGNVPLTPSEALNKKQSGVDAAKQRAKDKEKAAQDKIDRESAAFGTNTLEPGRKKINGLIKRYKNLSYRSKYYYSTGHMWVNDGVIVAIENFLDQKKDITTFDEPWTSASNAEAAKTTFKSGQASVVQGLRQSIIDSEGGGDFDDYFYNDYIKHINLINEIIETVNGITGSPGAGRIDAAKKNAEDVKEQNEALNEEISAIQKSINKEKEILSLSPVTSVENKNKTLFNLQLYDWREQARKGKDKTNLYKQTMTANSANPDSTGVSTLSLDFYYVRLGRMLEWIEKNLLVYDDTKKDPDSDDNEPNPIFKIDYNPENNFCLRFPAQFSSDPTVCLIPSKYKSDIAQWDILPNLSDYFVEGDDYKGKLMNIFINIDHTASVLNSNVDKNGKVSLLKFLTSLLNDVGDCLGNVNRLEPIFDTEENLLKIIESNGMDDIRESIVDATNEEEKEKNPMAVFQVYGIGNIAEPVGSFVTNVDFQVQLPPNMAAMATISAQAGGNIVGENATGLSKLNLGLHDRLITVKLDRASIDGAKTDEEDPKKIFNTTIQATAKEVSQLYTKKFYAKDSVSALRSNNRDIALYLTGNEALEEKMPSPFFIPFDLKVDMQGLSGMRNYERFSISEGVLPYSYRSGDQGGVIDFLIKGISHKINDNVWTTSINTLTVSSIRKWSTKNQRK